MQRQTRFAVMRTLTKFGFISTRRTHRCGCSITRGQSQNLKTRPVLLGSKTSDGCMHERYRPSGQQQRYRAEQSQALRGWKKRYGYIDRWMKSEKGLAHFIFSPATILLEPDSKTVFV